jgi:hypothetical protein
VKRTRWEEAVLKRRTFLQAEPRRLRHLGRRRPAIAQSAPEIKWRLTSSFPKSLDTIFGTAQTLCRYIAEASDNKFQIQPFAAGELVPGLQALDAVTSGPSSARIRPPISISARTHARLRHRPAVRPQHPSPAVVVGFCRRRGDRQHLARRSSTPTASRPATPARRWAAGSARRSRPSTISRASSSASAAWAGRSSRASAPFRSRSHRRHLSGAGAGTIDAAEFVGPYDDEKLGFYKVAKNYYFPGWWEGSAMLHLCINLEKWNALPKSYQSLVRQACDAANTWMLAKYDHVNAAALKRLIANGAVLKPFPMPVMEACYKATNEQFAEIAARTPTSRRRSTP